MPAATVVVTSFQQRRHLEAAVRSALEQDLGEVRVVVVDDGSNDGSLELLRGFGDAIRLVAKANGGQASAWNAAAELLRGDLVVLLDGDDVLRPDATRRALAVLDGTGAAKVHGALEVVDDQGRPAGPPVPRRPLDAGDLVPRVLADGPEVLGWPPTSGNAWRRDVLEALLPVPPEPFRTSPDVWACSLAITAGPVAALDAPVGAWRWHGGNASVRGDRLGRARAERERWWLVHDELARRLGAGADAVERWRAGSWAARAERALARIVEVVPPGEALVLVDEDQLLVGAELAGRPRLHLLTVDGAYGGRPADRRAAHEGLLAGRAAGTRWLAVAWPAAWWDERYELAVAGPTVHADDDVVIRRLEP